jgi:hypothetical protein
MKALAAQAEKGSAEGKKKEAEANCISSSYYCPSPGSRGPVLIQAIPS